MPGMRKSVWPSGAKFPSPGRRSASAVILRCRAGQQNEGWLCPPGQREERVQRHAGPVAGRPKLAEGCMRCFSPVLQGWRASLGKGRAQSWQRAADRPDGCNGASQSPQHGHAMLSPLCTRGAVVREHPLTAQALGRCCARQQNLVWLCPLRPKGTLMQRGFSGALGTGGDPAWGAKKVGEKPSFSPRASGGVSFRYDRYFGLVPK